MPVKTGLGPPWFKSVRASEWLQRDRLAQEVDTTTEPSSSLRVAWTPSGEYLHVRQAIPVSDRGEVELAGVGKRSDHQREIAHQRHQGDQLQQLCPGRYSGTGGPGTLVTLVFMRR